ncbi:lipase, gdsl [Niveomyces insectorum RCEF 264]|uniref:Lipase, gdsl n=1 Tax=Niveomyces insectorum RCEF 264 TaxID=1081102 RepID=A0A167WYM4_9HYPO|nr:lipase, gdsl [Niveomyces insectorum RCEF 264]
MAHKPLRILCFGDSLTGGYTCYGTQYHPYAETLVAKLRAAFPGLQVEVDVDGKDGGVTSDFLGQRAWSYAILKKSKVLALTVPELGTTRSSDMLARLDARRDQLNALIEGYTRKNFYAFDFKSAFSFRAMSDEERDRYWDDGVHFTAAGYDAMGEKVADAFLGILRREEEAAAADSASRQGVRPARPKKSFKDDDKPFEEEHGSPQDLRRGYVVVRRADLD